MQLPGVAHDTDSTSPKFCLSPSAVRPGTLIGLVQRPFFWLSYLRQGYRENEFEREARRAVDVTRPR